MIKGFFNWVGEAERQMGDVGNYRDQHLERWVGGGGMKNCNSWISLARKSFTRRPERALKVEGITNIWNNFQKLSPAKTFTRKTFHPQKLSPAGQKERWKSKVFQNFQMEKLNSSSVRTTQRCLYSCKLKRFTKKHWWSSCYKPKYTSGFFCWDFQKVSAHVGSDCLLDCLVARGREYGTVIW